MSSKGIDSFSNSERINLLKQRIIGNDHPDSNASNQSSEQGYTHFSGNEKIKMSKSQYDIKFDASTPTKSPARVPRADSIDETAIRNEVEKELKDHYETKLTKMKELLEKFIVRNAQLSDEIDSIELLQKQQRLGTLNTCINGQAKWHGGIEIKRIESDLEKLTRELDGLKKTEKSKGDPNQFRRSFIAKEISDKKKIYALLEEERRAFANQLRFENDKILSEYHPTQYLDDGRYMLIEYIGRGGFSEVWMAFDTVEIRLVAIKIQKMSSQWSIVVQQNFLKHLGREIEILRSTQHENVVTFYGHFYIGETTVALVIEYCSGGDLSEMIRRRGKIPEKEAKVILAQVIKGLLALRAKENYVIHYDLKPGNIIFNDQGLVKITDFGLSKIMDTDKDAIELTSQGTGTYYYAAPETFQKGKAVLITPSVDTWSLGIIFYEMLYGHRPFGEDISQKAYASQTENIGKITFSQSVKVSDAAKKFISECLETDQQKRPILESISKREYISALVNGTQNT